ncbi:hypothetical protein QUF76_13515, partial [Desulfobacterales bacterium HSG16]|nr:hypothetical protein [Desulfobacterales bacterium HSG16]
LKTFYAVKKNESVSNVAYHVTSGEKSFHKQGCLAYNFENSTKIFANRQNAVMAGYRACSRCSAYFACPQSKVFHLPNCNAFKWQNCKISFYTEKKAVEAGYQPCNKCIE